MNPKPFRSLLALCLAAALFTPVRAAEATVSWDDVYCFSSADFSAEACSGILLTQVPEDSLGALMLGTRQLRSGDAVPLAQLSQLTFHPSGEVSGEAVISCIGLSHEGTPSLQATLRLRGREDQPPTAEDSRFITYKNISGQVPLTVSDPEGDALTVHIVKEPKRGTLSLGEDGTVTYAPLENKVGKDSFVYTVTDPAGNTSPEATVRIEIQKPSDKQTYGDMEGDPALLAATWLREEGIFSGQTVSGQLLFSPEAIVSRGEFLAMCAGLTGWQGEAVSTGFADEADTPVWLGSYVTAALGGGYLRGIPTDQGLSLCPEEPITQAQAAALVSRMLCLGSGTASVMGQAADVPAWAASAVSAMAEIYPVTAPDAAMTRRDAAMLLYSVWQYDTASQERTSLLSWAEK